MLRQRSSPAKNTTGASLMPSPPRTAVVVDGSHSINNSGSPRKLPQGQHRHHTVVDDDDDSNNHIYEHFQSQSTITKRQQYWHPPPNNNSNNNNNREAPLRVDFRCACFKLSNISTVDFTVLIKFVIVFEWNDERLIASNITTNELPPDLWGPDVILENGNHCEVNYDSFSLMDNTTGRLKRTITFHGTVYNPMDLEDFPFDSDELEMKFISISNWRTLDGTRYGNDPCNRIYTLHPMLRRKDVPFLILGWGGT